MLSKKLIPIILSVLLAGLSACTLPTLPTTVVTSPPAADGTAAIQTQVAQIVASTQVAQTAIAGAIGGTLTALAPVQPQDSPVPDNTFTPTLTLEPTFTPTFTYTSTSAAARVSVSLETNCRRGPGLTYDILGVLKVGESAEIVGRDFGNGNWIIKLPSNPTIICWIWRNYATVTGDTTPVPVFTAQPTVTPSAAFSVAYVDITACAPQYAFHFLVKNTGSVKWESIRIVLTNTEDSTTTVHALDSFRSYEGCVVESNLQDLEPGESGNVANINPGQLAYNPATDPFSAVVTVCSENGQAGTCLSKTITFTP